MLGLQARCRVRGGQDVLCGRSGRRRACWLACRTARCRAEGQNALWTSSARSGRFIRWFSSEPFRTLSGRTGEMGVSSTAGACSAGSSVWGCCSAMTAAALAEVQATGKYVRMHVRDTSVVRSYIFSYERAKRTAATTTSMMMMMRQEVGWPFSCGA